MDSKTSFAKVKGNLLSLSSLEKNLLLYLLANGYLQIQEIQGQEVGSGWGTHSNPWLIHINVWQKPLRYCKVISLQLIKINEKKKFNVILAGDCGVTLPSSGHLHSR